MHTYTDMLYIAKGHLLQSPKKVECSEGGPIQKGCMHILTLVYVFKYFIYSERPPALAFTGNCFTSRLLCTNQSALYCPLPPALPALLQ